MATETRAISSSNTDSRGTEIQFDSIQPGIGTAQSPTFEIERLIFVSLDQPECSMLDSTRAM